jgi:hypothetical protein
MERNWIGVDVEEVLVLFRFLSSPSFFSSRCKIFSPFFCVLLCFSFSIFFFREAFFLCWKRSNMICYTVVLEFMIRVEDYVACWEEDLQVVF